MALPFSSHLEEPSLSNESRESHWLPALRPDTLDPISTSALQTIPDVTEQQQIPSTEKEISSITQSLDEVDFQHPDIVTQTEGLDNSNILPQVQRSTSFPVPTHDASEQSDTIEQTLPWETQAADQPATEIDSAVQRTENQAQVVVDEIDDSAEHPVVRSTLSGIDPVDTPESIEAVSSDRFNEGVPLLSSTVEFDQDVPNSLDNSSPKNGAFELLEGDADGTFFSQLNTTSGEDVAPPVLDRKSTTDVLKTLNFEDNNDGLDSPVDFFQQLGQNPEEVPLEISNPANQPAAEDAWAAVLDDEDDFLVEDADDLLPDSDPGSPSSFVASLQQPQDGIPIHEGNVREIDLNSPQSQYAPHQPSTSTLAPLSPTQLSPKAHGNVGFSRPGLEPMRSFQAHLQQPPAPQRAESFADQSKGGYKSPYDLPLDISKSKRKPQMARIVSQPQKGLPPPPRSSSMTSDKALQLPFDPVHPPGSAVTSPGSVPPTSAITASSSARPGTAPQRASSSSFFEELPVTARPRPSPNLARYTPTQPSIPGPIPVSTSATSSPPRRVISTPSQPSIPENLDSQPDFQLQPPQRLDPYANVALQATNIPPSTSSSRYSPAPGSGSGVPKPVPSPRYSPAPPSQLPASQTRYASQPVNAQAPSPNPSAATRYASQPTAVPPPVSNSFQPRTSSPLAYHSKPPEDQSSLMPPPPLPRTSSTNTAPNFPVASDYTSRSAASSNVPVLPPPQQTPPSAYTPEFTPPKRSQTQSPSRQTGPRPTFSNVMQGSSDRPASAHGTMSPTRAATSYVPLQSIGSNTSSLSDTVDFVPPSDGTETDPLERWKGAPVLRFGFGGQMVSSFPSRTPRYGSGMLKPQIKAGPGDVKVRKTSETIPLPSHVVNFPGPLKGKSKKKDLLSWLTASIARLDAESPSFLGLAQTVPDPRKRHEEKILLWRLMKILVEFDGHLDTAEAMKAINVALTPEIHAIDESTAPQYSEGNETGGTYRPRGASARLESINPVAVESIRKSLLKGSRKDAVWLAVDNRLWSHALLIASTLEPAVWKQVVQEFVRQEVKSVGNNAESLAALYEIFGGNMEDSIDQLVPPSARAGLQMVSTVDTTGPIKNALDGLDKWKETLALVLNNRCRDDFTALLTMARLLADYGRTEASHICFLFARNPAFPTILGGLDDPQASAVLLGADQRARPTEFHHDQDAILLTEVYEFATCTLAGASTAVPLPYLAPYKLHKAKLLADHGLKNEAQAYCDAVAAGLKATGKVSPYYHPLLLTELDELSNRLKQIPVQGGSWMSKPSIEKVSGSIFSKFTNFVAGDDSDAASQVSSKDVGNADIGPFANVSGSPNLSRSGSQTDIYGSYPAAAPVPTTAAGSRYAPNGVLSARSSSEFGRGRPSLDSQRSPPGTSYGNEPRQSLYSPLPPTSQTQSPARSVGGYQPLGTSPGQNFTPSPNYGNYQATPPQSSYLSNPTLSQPAIAEEQSNGPYMPTPPPEEHSPYMPSVPQRLELSDPAGQHAFGGYLAPQNNFSANLSMDEPAPAQEASQSYGYEPPADTGYVPYQPDPDSDDEGRNKKAVKKSFMDDHDDGHNYTNMSQSKQVGISSSADKVDDAARRKANDDAADAAFRAAAEADAQRAKDAAAAKRSSGWFGGWLGGAKKADASLDAKQVGPEQKVHRANLGESKMKLYYDKDLKKWINPDDPDSAKSKGATPPPPRMGGTPGPPRAGGVPAPPPLSRSSTPASTAGLPPLTSDGIAATLPPSVNASLGLSKSAAPSPIGPPPTPGSATAPTPNRTPTSAVSTNAIDDLLGPPTGARKVSGRGGKKAKGGRYVDVMAK